MSKKRTDDSFVRSGWTKEETQHSTTHSKPIILTDTVTIIMTSYRTHDFTLAALWAVFKYYPGIQVIIADGSTDEDFHVLNERLSLHFPGEYQKTLHAMLLPHHPTEDCRNAAASLVTTPYILFMDNDTKILGEQAIPMLLEPLEVYANCVQSGAYGYVCLDRERRIGCVGKSFAMKHTQLSASPAYFSLHLTAAYRDVGGMPKKFYYEIPDELWHDSDGNVLWQPGWSGDFSITDLYHNYGLVCVSPRNQVPVLHWGQTNRYINQNRPVEDFWYENVRHIQTEPFIPHMINDVMYTEKINGNFESLFEIQPRRTLEDNL